MTDTSKEAVERLVIRLMQARDHAQRFIDYYFKNDAERPQISIPASTKYDSDLIVHQAIKDAQETIPALTPDDARAALEAMLAEAEKRGKKRGLLWAAEICDECYLAKRAANEIRAEAKE
jgi:hypothetical protein